MVNKWRIKLSVFYTVIYKDIAKESDGDIMIKMEGNKEGEKRKGEGRRGKRKRGREKDQDELIRSSIPKNIW